MERRVFVTRTVAVCLMVAGMVGCGPVADDDSPTRVASAGRGGTDAAGRSLTRASSDTGAGRRVALVMGNASYAGSDRLANPVNDARAVAAALTGVGFAVTAVEDATRTRMATEIATFASGLGTDDVALFYFAGHGTQVDNENYLIPTDFAGRTEESVRLGAIGASEVQRAIGAARVAMLVLDACRDNRFRDSRGGPAGLAPMEARGTLIAYATGAGQTASDNAREANGLFTSKFLEALEVPGLTATELFRQVRREVYEASRATQWPAVYDDLLSDFVFRVGGDDGSSVEVATTEPAEVMAAGDAPAVVQAQREDLFWESIRESSSPADIEAYLRQFPDGLFRELATNRLVALRAVTADPPAPERRAPGTAFRDCADCPEMAVIRAGRFRMGCVSGRDCQDDELPVRDVEVRSFALGKYEVTFEEYERFSGATGRDRPRDSGWGRGGRPVINVSWNDAVAYAAWLSDETGEDYRLPSESEWEYAARAGTRTRYHWGQDIGRNRANCLRCGSSWGGRTAPVGSFAANGWGLYDMHGNVGEWVDDCWHENYARAPLDGRAWTRGGECGLHVVRGGSWFGNPVTLRSANRGRNSGAGTRFGTLGFRVARTLD